MNLLRPDMPLGLRLPISVCNLWFATVPLVLLGPGVAAMLQMAQHITIICEHSDTTGCTRGIGCLLGRLILYTCSLMQNSQDEWRYRHTHTQ